MSIEQEQYFLILNRIEKKLNIMTEILKNIERSIIEENGRHKS